MHLFYLLKNYIKLKRLNVIFYKYNLINININISIIDFQ